MDLITPKHSRRKSNCAKQMEEIPNNFPIIYTKGKLINSRQRGQKRARIEKVPAENSELGKTGGSTGFWVLCVTTKKRTLIHLYTDTRICMRLMRIFVGEKLKC